MNKTRSIEIAVIGLGYVGLPLAVELGKKYPTVGEVTMTRFLRTSIAAFATLGFVVFLAATAPIWAADGKKHILIVDMGNIMRSVIAEQLIERKLMEDELSDRFSVSSHGLQGTPATPVGPREVRCSRACRPF